MPLSAEERAERSARAMWEGDAASRWLGAEIVRVGPGAATLRLCVAAHHLNGHGIVHGGVIFTLADSAFAFACNSYNRCAVAQHAGIEFLAPGREGTVLLAEAGEVTVAGRSGVYDVTVREEGGALLATFRGLSRQVRGQHFDEEAPA